MSEETKEKLNNVKDKVLKTIKADEVTMRSRYYFVARSMLWVVGTVLAFGLTLYLISFVAFVFRGNGLLLLPHLGPGGWFNLFLSLPWILLLGVFVVFMLLQVLSTHFSFVYKRPLVHSILGSIFVLVIGGVAIGQTQLHDRAYQLSQEHRLPVAGLMYRDAIRDRGDVHIGTVETLKETDFIFIDRTGETYTVELTDETRIPLDGIKQGMTVMVVGTEEDDVITAHGVRPFDTRKPSFPQKRLQDAKNGRGTPLYLR